MVGSFVIVDIKTNIGVYEFYNEKIIKHVNTKKYKVMTIIDYLYQLNTTIKNATL